MDILLIQLGSIDLYRESVPYEISFIADPSLNRHADLSIRIYGHTLLGSWFGNEFCLYDILDAASASYNIIIVTAI